jgi:hypothetical protein
VSRPRRFFPPEYKAEVVELIRSTGKTVGQVAKELDLTETAVREWVNAPTWMPADATTASPRSSVRSWVGCAVRSARSSGRPRFLRQGDRSPVPWYRLIEAEKAHHGVSRPCRVLGVAPAVGQDGGGPGAHRADS